MLLFSILLLCVTNVWLVDAATSSSCAPSVANMPQPSDLPIINTLPDPFTFRLSNRRVASRGDWECRREELMVLVQQYLYGFYPDHSRERVHARREGNSLTITVSVEDKSATFNATVVFPPETATDRRGEGVPVVITTGPQDLVPANVTSFLESGVAVAQFEVNTVANDSYTRIGAFWDLYGDRDIGVMTAWAWAEHRILDAIEQVVPEIDTSRVGVAGCSRYGKTALAAAIFDQRIKLALPLSSGAEGIGPWRYYYESQGAAEKIENITTNYGYWSDKALWKFDNVTGNSTRVPFDAHELVGLVAPRAILWDEGQEDWWTNPEGSLGVVFPAAKIIFDWLGVGENIGIHVRHPPDDLHCGESAYPAIQPFVKKVFFGTPTAVNFSDISPYSPHPEAYPWAKHLPKS
ncbi:carbohydrate esterase family 15 protein [Polyporus arcularius HHB13444]|uniref:(4-O-methyl)-D-glucuronate--lignin esterase n=1 Tax=Polyporus arcularius HHB13444 TaxID=1314778 RepID=A0A5C3Q3T7_9APHY|nr:carbohydrate esterase family 15 protein [Polyporus arcularius HHB13444]